MKINFTLIFKKRRNLIKKNVGIYSAVGVIEKDIIYNKFK